MKVVCYRKLTEKVNGLIRRERWSRLEYMELPEPQCFETTNFEEACAYINNKDHTHTNFTYAGTTAFRKRKYISIIDDYHETSRRVYEKKFKKYSFRDEYLLWDCPNIQELMKDLTAEDFTEWWKDNVGTNCPFKL